MSGRRFWVLAALMLAAGAAVRVNNAMTFSPLRAYDGFSHFSYIWFMAEHWTVPLATAGWEFFQPPLYYAAMAALWDVLEPADPVLRLRLGTMVIALLGLTHAVASYLIVRRYFPGRRVLHLLAPGLMLFLPVHLYSAGFLGNENLTAILSTMSLVALLATLRRSTPTSAALLGLCLGLTMLTKFTGLVVVAGTFATLGARALACRTWAREARLAGIAGLAMLVVCGWYYARNVSIFGTPFKMSRETFMLQRYERVQTRGRRTILEYVLFDPVILRRPQWPRGVPLTGERSSGSPYSAARESVLTGVYANAWFDGYGGWVLPSVTQDEGTRRSGQLLLTLGLVPSLLALAGLGVAVSRLWRRGWDDTLVAMLLTFGAMIALLVQGTREVPIHAAVKATYLTPVSVVFSFWLALGADWLGRVSRRWRDAALAACVVLAVASVLVFLQGRLVARSWFADWLESGAWRNLYGVVYYAAGDRARARELFELAAGEHLHLAYENLATLALEDRRPLEALYYLRNAARLQPRQSFGTPEDRALFEQLTRAEYSNTMAVIYDRLGWRAAAVAAARASVADDPAMPEAKYDLAVLKLTDALDGPARWGTRRRALALAQSRRLLFDALVQDPAFDEARALAGAVEALGGDCAAAVSLIGQTRPRHPLGQRRYPVTTGVGDMQAAAVRRRRHIERLPAEILPERQLERCRQREEDRAA